MGDNIYFIHKNGLIKILNNLKHVGSINPFSEHVILKTSGDLLLLYSNSSISIIENDNSKKIFQSNKKINDFVYNNNIMYIICHNNIYMYILKLTNNNYKIIPLHIQEYLFYIYIFCNKNLVNDLTLEIINLICHISSISC